MIKGSKVVTTAKNYLGVGGSIFCKAYGLDHIVDWCVIYVWYVLKKAGAPASLLPKCDNAAIADSYLRRSCKWVSISEAAAGDIVIMTWKAGAGNNKCVGSRDHIGIVVEPINKSSLKTIEGNTGSESCTKSKVNYRTRSAQNIYAVYHPDYAAESKDLTQLVKNTLLGKYGNGAARKKALGSDYTRVQSEVTRITKLTNDTLANKYGTGATRKKALGKDYDLVQWNINRIYANK